MKNKLKENRWTIIITSLIALLPMVFGIIMWDKLPEQMATHWGANGAADGFSGKTMAIFGVPAIMLALHWLCIIMTAIDPNNRNSNSKMFRVILWLMPLLSIAVNSFIYIAAFDIEMNVFAVMQIILGLLFIVIGNYLPKCKRNSTMGIKLPWTLSNDENWNKTHRVGGWLWMLGGVIILLGILLPGYGSLYLLGAVLLAAILVPLAYSYGLYRRQLKNGTFNTDELADVKKLNSAGNRIAMIAVPIIIAGVAVIMFTGNVEAVFGDESVVLDSVYWSESVIEYDSIAEAEYHEQYEAGMKVNGFNSARLALGYFENKEFGRYISYAYTACDSCVVLTSHEGDIIVLNGADDDATRALYDEISARING